MLKIKPERSSFGSEKCDKVWKLFLIIFFGWVCDFLSFLLLLDLQVHNFWWKYKARQQKTDKKMYILPVKTEKQSMHKLRFMPTLWPPLIVLIFFCFPGNPATGIREKDTINNQNAGQRSKVTAATNVYISCWYCQEFIYRGQILPIRQTLCKREGLII